MFKFLRRLLRNEEGSNLAYTAFLVIPLIGAVGVGTDGARGYLVRAKLSTALDAAALAGAHKKNNVDEMEADIRAYFNANYPDGYMDSQLVSLNFSYDADNEKVTVTASVSMPTTFMRIFGKEDIVVGASTEVTRETNFMDVVMSIDMSGSMAWGAPGGGSRIAAARSAATILVDTLFGDRETSELLKIGIVPWNGKVNVSIDGVAYNRSATGRITVPAYVDPRNGNTRTRLRTPNNTPVRLYKRPANGWMGCVYARYTDNGVDDDADHVDGDVNHPNGDWVAWVPIESEGEPVSGGTCSSSTISGDECTPCLNKGIRPLINQKTPVKNYINSLTNPNGTTNIAAGLMWGARVFSPAAPFSEADPDPDGPRTQAIVLLTDGEHVRDFGDAYARQLSNSELDARLRLIAANIKAQGILIYTIQFANGGGSNQEQLMKDVASQPNSPYYHFAPTAQELQRVFTTIANHLSKLRISK